MTAGPAGCCGLRSATPPGGKIVARRSGRPHASAWMARVLLRREGGAFTPLVAVAALALFVAIGLAVDGAGRMTAIQHADNVAAEAARAGGQAIDLPLAITGRADIVDAAAARAAAQAYLRQAGVTGTVTVDPAGDRLTVTVTITYRPIMLGLIGAGRWTATGSATAQLITG